tara:strand:- start:4330 stop:4635 length:306 start_codon:yes stop_codon:yes gene_type:complete
MARTKKARVKFLKSGKKSTTRAMKYSNKKNKKFTKRINPTIKNLGKGKRNRTNKRIKRGSQLKKMNGGGPSFQPLTDTARSFIDLKDNIINTMEGNDPARS